MVQPKTIRNNKVLALDYSRAFIFIFFFVGKKRKKWKRLVTITQCVTNYIDKYLLINIIILVGGKMKKLDLEKIINTNKPELTFLVGKTLCGKTKIIQEITKSMIKKHIPTLLFCFEMPKIITINNIIERNSSELELNNCGIYVGTSCYIEKMYDQIKELK